MLVDIKKLRLMPCLMCSFAVIQVSVTFSAFAFLMPLSYIIMGLCILSFLVMLVLFFRQPEMSLFEFATFFYVLVIIISSIINETDVKHAAFSAIDIGLLLLTFRYFSHKMRMLTQTIAFTMSACIYANILLMLLFPEWLLAGEDVFDSFLLGGNYNQMGPRLLVGLIYSLICSRYNRCWLVNSVILFAVIISTLVWVGSMTALSSIIIFAIIYLIPSLRVQKIALLSFFLFYLLFHVFVVFNGESLHNNGLAVYIVEDVLEKDITFTNRTGMWDAAMRVIAKSPFIGYGLVDKEWYYTNMSTFAIGPHNFILAQLIYGGLGCLMLFIIIVALAVRNMLGGVNRAGITLLLGMQTLLLMMTFEVYPVFFLFLLLFLSNFHSTVLQSADV